MKSIFENVGKYIDGLKELAEQIPTKNLNSAMSIKVKGCTLIIVKKREVEEIKKNLQEISNILV